MSIVDFIGKKHLRHALILAVALTCTGPVQAQTSQRWTEPGGRFSLEFGALGWSELPPNPSEGDTLLVAIEHREFQSGGQMRTCFVTERRQALGASVSQARVNTSTSAMAAAGVERSVGATIDESEIVEVDGATVIDASYTAQWQQHMRLFYLADGAFVRQILINCAAPPPVGSEVADGITNLLGTLRFGVQP